MIFLKTSTIAPFLLAAVMGTFARSVATDQSAEAVFQRHSLKLESVVSQVEVQQESTLNKCIPVIKTLLKFGQFDEAKKEAKYCIVTMLTDQDATERQILDLQRSCMKELEQLGAKKMQQLYSEKSDQALQRIDGGLQASSYEIKSLFGKGR
jgi:hypothetical protein